MNTPHEKETGNLETGFIVGNKKMREVKRKIPGFSFLTSEDVDVTVFQFTNTVPRLIASDILLRLIPMPALATESRRSEASTVLTCGSCEIDFLFVNVFIYIYIYVHYIYIYVFIYILYIIYIYLYICIYIYIYLYILYMYLATYVWERDEGMYK